MFGKLIGAYVGSRIDRRDGRGGFKGAVMGAATSGLLRRAGPVGMAVAGVLAARTLIKHRRGSSSGIDRKRY
ncbi:MAG: hypothetical protein JWM38_781 [Sphingomonas bacterium]|jgi:hypothetical protein|nr:hypothetical protein [Sphingomonas bacterium]MDB5683639.1 hypothetical protein [Sphingomonas bacterium]MDB5717354.1 hypothetical protein [Sphingomonas bacterium]